MKLYHFTSHLHLPYILKQGICFGHIPMVRETGVWLTVDQSPSNQKWGVPGMNSLDIDKTVIRLRVEIPISKLPKIHQWRQYATRHISDAEGLKDYEAERGSPESVLKWFIYQGVILPEWIMDVREMQKMRYSREVRRAWKEHRASRAFLRSQVKN